MNKPIVVFPRGQLMSKDRRTLLENGYVVVEADTPHQVEVVTLGAEMQTVFDAMTTALAQGSSFTHKDFGQELLRRLVKRQKVNEPEAPQQKGGES